MSLSKFIKLATGVVPPGMPPVDPSEAPLGLDKNGDPIVPRPGGGSTVKKSIGTGGVKGVSRGGPVQQKQFKKNRSSGILNKTMGAPKPKPNLTPTINDLADWLKPMGIGGAAGAGIQYWRRQKEIDRYLKAGYSQAEAEDLVETNVGAGALLGAGLGAGYKYYNDPYTGPRKT